MQFSKWKLWDNRAEHLSINYPGIYALSINDGNIEGQDFQLTSNICYFGMTNSKQGLKGRLGQFNNTLRDKKGGGHGGAERFRYDYKSGESLALRLFVSVWPFPCNTKEPTPDDYRQMGQVTKAEYDAFALYLEEFGNLPKYNDHKASPKHKKS
ncbi:MAG: hypothetical protein V7721_02320 [Porticoccaceae bacterium]